MYKRQGVITTECQDEPLRIVRHRTPAQAQRERAISKLTKVFKLLEQDGAIRFPIKADYATASVYIERFKVASLKFNRNSGTPSHELVLHNDVLDMFDLRAADISSSFSRALNE